MRQVDPPDKEKDQREQHGYREFYVNKDWPPPKVAERFHVAVDRIYLVKHRITEAIRSEVKRLQSEIT